MRKWIVCAVLVVGAAAFVAIPDFSSAVAQEKDKKAKDKDTKSKGTASIDINQSAKDGKFRFTVRNADGKLLAQSSPTGFATEKDARAAVDELKAVVSKAKVNVMKADKKDKKDKK